jgi:hypothetical protein
VDGRSIKAVLDAFTKAGIWRDDNSKIVQEVAFSQEFAEEDETVIELYEGFARAELVKLEEIVELATRFLELRSQENGDALRDALVALKK